MLKNIYLSPLGRIISILQRVFAVFHRPFLVYGYHNSVTNTFNKLTRISSTTAIVCRKKLDIQDNVWIGHYCHIDASSGIKIGEGCQIGSWVGIFTHSSHLSIRLLGKRYVHFDPAERIGYQRDKVEIGGYTFIGAASLVMPGVKIGKGCIIAPGSIVTKAIPDYSVASGNPAKVIQTTRILDHAYMNDPVVIQNYFDQLEIHLPGKSPEDSGKSIPDIQ